MGHKMDNLNRQSKHPGEAVAFLGHTAGQRNVRM